MTKTVKQIVDEYLEKQQNNGQNREFTTVRIIKMNGCNSMETKTYHNVRVLSASAMCEITLYGINLHKITFTHTDENGMQRTTVIGKIVEFNEKMGE